MVEVTPQIVRHLTANMNLSKKQIIAYNFLGGLAWGTGTVIGASIIAAILVSFLKHSNFIPGLNEFLKNPQQLQQQIDTP